MIFITGAAYKEFRPWLIWGSRVFEGPGTAAGAAKATRAQQGGFQGRPWVARNRATVNFGVTSNPWDVRRAP